MLRSRWGICWKIGSVVVGRCFAVWSLACDTSDKTESLMCWRLGACPVVSTRFLVAGVVAGFLSVSDAGCSDPNSNGAAASRRRLVNDSIRCGLRGQAAAGDSKSRLNHLQGRSLWALKRLRAVIMVLSPSKGIASRLTGGINALHRESERQPGPKSQLRVLPRLVSQRRVVFCWS